MCIQAGWTPLHVAAWPGHPAVVEAMVAVGADVEAKDRVSIYKGSRWVDSLID
jgi:ankyrin repeat protein